MLVNKHSYLLALGFLTGYDSKCTLGLLSETPYVHMKSTSIKKPSARKSLCLFTNILDDQQKTVNVVLLQQNTDAKP